eukprot:1176138-Prorocentrum_minimum.AAC.5
MQEAGLGKESGETDPPSAEPKPTSEANIRNTCMNSPLPWDPYLFENKPAAKSAAARRLLFKGERPMIDNNPNRLAHRSVLGLLSVIMFVKLAISRSTLAVTLHALTQDCPHGSTMGWFNEDLYLMCKKAKKTRTQSKVKMTPELEALRDCLKATSNDGSCAGMKDLETVRKAASELPGVKRLMVRALLG